MKRSLPFFFILLLMSCQGSSSHAPEADARFQGSAMTIRYTILIGRALGFAERYSIQSIIDQTFSEIDSTYNKWNPYSELSALNKLPKGVAVPISPGLEGLLTLSDTIHRLTFGRFDPTMEPLQDLWRRNLESGTVPSSREVDELLPALGWDKIHFASGQFYKDHDLVSIDLSGIAKGFCVDLLIERLGAAGFPDIFVEWGGEVRAAGRHPAKRPWTVFISRLNDADPERALAIVPLKDQALATSGDYLQNWTTVQSNDPKKTVTYTHIMDPLNKRPLIATHQSIATASVLAPSCALADGLATAAMIFSSPQEARSWALAIQDQIPTTIFWIASRSELYDQNEKEKGDNAPCEKL